MKTNPRVLFAAAILSAVAFTSAFTHAADPLPSWNDHGSKRAILAFVDQAIAASPKAVEEYRAGKTATIQFLVGQVMKLSRGKSNPQTVLALLKEKLG